MSPGIKHNQKQTLHEKHLKARCQKFLMLKEPVLIYKNNKAWGDKTQWVEVSRNQKNDIIWHPKTLNTGIIIYAI